MRDVGELVLGVGGKWMIRPPEKCRNGHTLAGHCKVTSQPCQCRERHVSWCCEQCGEVTYGRPLGVNCVVLNGPARIR